MASTEEKGSRRGARLLPRLASLAVRHADLLVVTGCIAGLIAFLLLPALAKSTYISENALIPGSASPKFVLQDAVYATQIAQELRMLSHNKTNGLFAVWSSLQKYLIAMDADIYLQPFLPPRPPFSSMHFFTSQQLGLMRLKESNEEESDRSKRLGMNIAGILRAPRGEGNEAIVLVTPFDAENLTDADTLALGLGLSLLHLLSKAAWLAKDIIWLAADSHYGPHFGLAAWLEEYHEPMLYNTKKLHDLFEKDYASLLSDDLNIGDFKRAGVIAAGIVFSLQQTQGRVLSDSLTVYAEGPNGQMPNLDLINVVNNLAVYREGLHMQLDTAAIMLDWAWLHSIGQFFEKLGQIAGFLNSGWRFGVPAFEYVQGSATLARSLFLQAQGVPTGAHGAFRDYQIDAVTIMMSIASQPQGGHTGSLRKFGRLLEGTVRSVNNLLEKFHQSFFLYFLTGPNRFVSVGIYIVPLLLLLITLPLKAAALCSEANDSKLKSSAKGLDHKEKVEKCTADLADITWFPLGSSLSFARWTFAVLTVCLVELWAVLVAICPPLVYHIAASSDSKFLLWVAVSAISLSLLILSLPCIAKCMGLLQDFTSCFEVRGQWAAIKAATLGAATIGIGIMSSINFATALTGAVLLVPMCVSVYPVKRLGKERSMQSWLAALVGVAFTFVSSLPILFVFSKGLFDKKPELSTAVLWNWVESMWHWGSATYLYLFLVHLPCSVLCHFLLLSGCD